MLGAECNGWTSCHRSDEGSEEEKFQEQYANQLLELEEGAVVDGVVKNITDYGAFVSLGIIDGLLHINKLKILHKQN